MYKKWSLFLFVVLFGLSFNLCARQQGGGDDLKGVCELAGGTWTGNEGGNWACCWADWGCYGCYNGVCKMQCRTKRCRDANRMRAAKPGTKSLKELAPAGKIAPIVPVK
ncbi:acetyltransferase [Legionella lansingensis]|uniref:Acetyltransferase n=1 Tax=Legionella lansingensis TaxID=45067 RepID=A0A0W0VLH0_9GAMM|nr:hypothetical protein [Legionella lansingensis]KTD20978.1 acetyltransferase [Legionella lansingensis]SNV44695.1 acetyltransferase [Legionella lansingensis]